MYVLKGKKKVLAIVLGCVAVLAAALISLYVSLTWQVGPETGETAPEPSSAMVGDVVKSALTSGEIRLTGEELNGFLAYLGEVQDNETLKGLVLQVQPDDTLKVWAPVDKGWLKGTAWCRASVAFEDKTLRIQVLEAGMGTLSLPPSFVLSLAEEKLPEGISRDGDSLVLQTPGVSLDQYGVDISVSLTDLYVEDGEIVICTDTVQSALGWLLQEFANQF